MRELMVESGKYATASAVAFAADLALLTFLVKVAGWTYVVAAAFSFTAAGVLLYLLCVKFVFRFRRITNRALELPYFIGLGLVGLAVNVGVIFIAVEKLQLPLIPAKLVASGCTFGINFLLRRVMLFSAAVQPGRP